MSRSRQHYGPKVGRRSGYRPSATRQLAPLPRLRRVRPRNARGRFVPAGATFAVLALAAGAAVLFILLAR